MAGYAVFYEDVLFIEGYEPALKPVTAVSVDLSFKFGAQLKNLNDVKRSLADKARIAGCNCVADFKYGQKSRWLAIDDVAWHGSGTAGTLPPEVFSQYVEKIRSRG